MRRTTDPGHHHQGKKKKKLALESTDSLSCESCSSSRTRTFGFRRRNSALFTIVMVLSTMMMSRSQYKGPAASRVVAAAWTMMSPRQTKRRSSPNTLLGMATDSRQLRFFGGASSSVSRMSVSSQDGQRSSPDPTSNHLFKDLTDAYVNVLLHGSSKVASVMATSAAATTSTSKRGEEGEEVRTSRSSSSSATTLGTEPTGAISTDLLYFAASSSSSTAVTTAAGHRRSYATTTTTFQNNGGDDDDGTAERLEKLFSRTHGDSDYDSKAQQQQNQQVQPKKPQTGYGPSIELTNEERELFQLLRRVRAETHLDTTLRVAGGWVRDKLLATPEFRAYHHVFDVGNNGSSSNNNKNNNRLTSKFRTSSHQPLSSSLSHPPSKGRQGTKVLLQNQATCHQPVDIDIALDDMLGREFADHLNEYLTAHGRDEVAVGVVLKNPEKSKHLETATMKVGSFWIDFVNLRAEEYTQDSRIPDLMRIGTPDEDAFRRDLTINALFYNVNTGQVEDWTGRGFQDLRKGIVATPLPPLTTLLDDPLRVLRSIRFAARLRFGMDDELVAAAQTGEVGNALAQKVSRERVGGELDLMLRSPDPVGAVRLLMNLKLANTVFSVGKYYQEIIQAEMMTSSQDDGTKKKPVASDRMEEAVQHVSDTALHRGLDLLSTAHDHLADCRWSPPVWCLRKPTSIGAETEVRLIDDQESRRLLWYAAFLKPIYDDFKIHQANVKPMPKRQAGSKKANRSIVTKLLVDELKRPGRDADNIERIIKAADDFTQLLKAGCDVSATMILLSELRVTYRKRNSVLSCDMESNVEECDGSLVCSMSGREVDTRHEDDPVWEHAMEFRLLCSKVLQRVGPLWRAALFLAISQELVKFEKLSDMEYTIEGDVFDESQEERRQGVMERFDTFAAALQQLGLIGIWNEKPLADGGQVKRMLPKLPKGPAFRDVMEEQSNWMATHPGAGVEALELHLQRAFPDFCETGVKK